MESPNRTEGHDPLLRTERTTDLNQPKKAARGRGVFGGVCLGFLLLLFMPHGVSGQERWRGGFLYGGLTGGEQGGALVAGASVEVGITEKVRGAARYFRQFRTLCAEDGNCPPEASGAEFGLGYRLGGTSRLVPFGQLLFGYARIKDYFEGGSDTLLSSSMILGVDLRVAPPLTLRLALHHQEVPASHSVRRSNARNSGLFIGLGFSGFGRSPLDP